MRRKLRIKMLSHSTIDVLYIITIQKMKLNKYHRFRKRTLPASDISITIYGNFKLASLDLKYHIKIGISIRTKCLV